MATPATNHRVYTAPALAKGLDILELMASEPDTLSLGQVAERLGRSKGEIFRMLVVLHERGYIYRDRASETYGITLKLFDLTHRQPRIRRLSAAATPAMSKLSQVIEQSSHLVIYYDGKGIVVAQQDSPTDRNFGVRLGADVPLTNSCSGHILLAFSSAKQRAQMLKSAGPKARVPRSDLEKRMGRVLDQGFESVDSQQVLGVKDIGYPVFDYIGDITAALVVPFLEHLDGSNKVDLECAKRHLADAAASISSALGYRSSPR